MTTEMVMQRASLMALCMTRGGGSECLAQEFHTHLDTAALS